LEIHNGETAIVVSPVFFSPVLNSPVFNGRPYPSLILLPTLPGFQLAGWETKPAIGDVVVIQRL